MTPDEVVGKLIAKYRQEAGMTQEALGRELGTMLGVHWTYLSRLEVGRTQLKVPALIAIFRCLHMDPARFIEEADAALKGVDLSQ